MDQHHRSDSSPIFQIGPRSNVLIQGGEFVQHNSAGHNCYNATGTLDISSHFRKVPVGMTFTLQMDSNTCKPM